MLEVESAVVLATWEATLARVSKRAIMPFFTNLWRELRLGLNRSLERDMLDGTAGVKGGVILHNEALCLRK